VVIALAGAGPARAGSDAIRVIASDASGVTLRLETGPVTVATGRTPGRSAVISSLLQRTSQPGRPALPIATTLIALPPGAHARVTVLGDGEPEIHDGVRLEVASKPDFKRDADGTGFVPTRVPVPAIADGRWPRGEAELGEPFPLRRQRLVPVTLSPVAYDEGMSRLWVRTSLTVRVDFVGGPGAGAQPFAAQRAIEDRHWDAVLERAVANFSVARTWREPARRAVRRMPGSSNTGGRAAGRSGAAATLQFDEDQPEVRVQIDTTGFYALAYAQLASKGFPAGTPIGQVSVHRHEFREGETPAYETIELPIDIDDQNGDGIFNGSDRIFVYVQNWTERATPTIPQRRWGNAEVIYATVLTSRAPLRFTTRPSWNGTPGLTPLASYPWKQRYERDFAFFGLPDDTLIETVHWTPTSDLYLGARPDTFGFETNQLDKTHPADIAITLVGRDYGGHLVRAEVRNLASSFFTPIGDSIVFVGKVTRTLSGTVPGDSLGEGNVNRMRIYGRQSQSPPDPVLNPRAIAGIDYYDVTYWRAFRALRNYLACNNAGAAGDIQIHATGFASRRIHIFDVSNPVAPVRLSIAPADSAIQIAPSGSEFTVDFQDVPAPGEDRRYVVFASSSAQAGAKSLPPARYTAVTREQLTSKPRADMLIVTPAALVSLVTPLANLRASQGLAVTIAPVEAIYDEFNGGRKSAYAVKRFVRYAFDNWDSKFLLLVGDASQDPLNRQGNSGVDLVPALDITGPVGIPLGFEIVPSDPWYGCLDNTCDRNDAIVDVPEMFIGRLPAKDSTQVADMVDKLTHYEDLTGDQSWRQRLVLSSDDAYSGETFFGGGSTGSNYCYKPEERVFEEISDTVSSVIRNRAGLQAMDTTPFSLTDELAGANRPNCADLEAIRTSTHAGITPKLLTRLNDGCLWWNWQGHANMYVLAHENLYLNSSGIDDKDALTNADRPFFFTAFSCHANAFALPGEDEVARGPSLGEELVTLPGRRGGIASWASVGYEILPDQFVQGWHINTALAEALFENPASDPYLDYRGARVILGESIVLALTNYLPANSFFERGIGLTYNLLGDPATRISIGEAQAFVRANGTGVSSGQVVRLRTVGDTLHLEANLVSNVQITSIALLRTDGAGTDTIPAVDYTLTPAFPDTGAGLAGGRRFALDYHTTLAPTSFRYTLATIDRYGVPGSFDVVFQFLTQLRLGGVPIADNDPVPPNAQLSLQVLSPTPLVPLTDLTLTVDGGVQAFTASPANADTSGREWILSWTHPPYAAGDHFARLAVNGGGNYDHRFRVPTGSGELALQNAMNFPNPFEEELGTHFSFYLFAGGPADLLLRVFTISGRLVYERIEKGLSPGYHQLAWDGRDHEGEALANGVYLCRMIATSGSEKAEQTLRMVKTRKPHHGEDASSTP
jgi:hypothetical protein